MCVLNIVEVTLPQKFFLLKYKKVKLPGEK